MISYLAANLFNDPITRNRQDLTTYWWTKEKSKHQIYISDVVYAEIQLGDSFAAKRRLGIAQKLDRLEINHETLRFAQHLISNVPFTKKAQIDAIHIAVATVYELDYLITWDFKHIANANYRSKFEVLAESMNLRLPIICTPEELVY